VGKGGRESLFCFGGRRAEKELWIHFWLFASFGGCRTGRWRCKEQDCIRRRALRFICPSATDVMFRFRASQDFGAEGPGELSISRGELVMAQSDVPQEGWLHVKSLNSGGQGFVPFAFLESARDVSQQQPQVPSQGVAQAAASSSFPEGSLVDQFDGPPPALNPSLNPSGPFSNLGSSLGSGLLEEAEGQELSADEQAKRHSYTMSSSQKDQYRVTNPTQFQETLELWRERERRFLKGEPERLPAPKRREYFYWTRSGQRVGPLTEEEMRAKFDTRELSIDTPIALNVESEQLDAAELQEYFPSINDAFQTVPKVEKSDGETMWVYLDDMGVVQGPFPARQMREWFQQGYFNEFSKAKLANSGDDQFVRLGLLFPEGQGAFLSEGDQFGAKARQAEIDAQGEGPRQPASSFAEGDLYTAGSIPFGTSTNGDPTYFGGPSSNNPFSGETGAANPFMSSDSGYGWDRLEPAAAPPPAQGGGKALLVRALSGDNINVPPALGAEAGTPPAALNPNEVDDWGVNWSDEEDELHLPSASDLRKSSSSSMGENHHPLTVAEDEDDEGSTNKKKPTISTYAELESKYLSSVDSLYVFLTRSLPKSLGVVRCKVKRSVVGLHVNYNLYELFLERDDGTLGRQIMIAQKHRKFGLDSYYNLAIGSVNQKESGKVIASLIFNALGTNFVCHNNVSAHKGKPRDLVAVVYQRNVGRGPRKFQVALPALKESSETEQVEWQHNGSAKRSKMLQALASLDFEKLQPLVNKKPVWSTKHRAWTLNFHGRVSRSSVKNFQLVRPNEDSEVVVQFGRIGTDSFTMDMQWPISPVAAFAIAVSSMHQKLGVE